MLTFQAATVLLVLLASESNPVPPSSYQWRRGSIDSPDVAYSGGEVMIIRVWNPRQISALARRFDAYKTASELNFDFSGTCDKEFAAILPFPSVEVVRIFEEQALTDESLRVLARFPELRELFLQGTSVTGEGFTYFAAQQSKEAGGPPLQSLLLAQNKITDEGLRALAKIKTLRRLFISLESGITAEGALEHLPKLDQPLNLAIVYHEKRQWITTEEQQQLQMRMPRCQLTFGVKYGELRKKQYAIGTGNKFLVPE